MLVFLAVVLGVVGGSADAPEITLHRALAARLILLCDEVSLVGSHVHEVFRALRYCTRYRTESRTDLTLTCRDGCGAFHFLAQVEAVTVGTGGRRYAVGAKQHFVAAVLRVVTRFCECAGYGINTGAPFYFSHILAWAETSQGSLFPCYGFSRLAGTT